MSEALRTLRAEPLRRFKPYPGYKDSGVEWLGEIPAHWEVKRLKHLAHLNSEALTEETDPGLEINYVDIGGVDSLGRVIGKENLTFATAPTRARRLVRDGDVIVSTVRTYLRAIAPIKNPEPGMVVSTGFAVVRPGNELTTDYAAYALRAPYFVERVVANSKGVSFPAINESEMATYELAVPSEPEQRAIAAFLDRETARIDALVAKKERLIELLQEKRTALITRAVTKGLDPTVPMKDSGVEWLGEIPAHWEVKRLKHLARIASGLAPPTSFDRSIGDYPVYGSNGLIGFCDQFFVRAQTLAVGRVGASGLVNVIPAKSWVSDNALLLWELRPATLLTWLRYVLETMNLATQAARNAQPIITGTFLGNRPLALPPEPEQRAIAAFLDRETAKLDALVAKVREAIERLKEYRTALISAAVTGKIDVREAAA